MQPWVTRARRTTAQEGLKEYQKLSLADDLGKAYGENTSAPPKGRRAGVLLHPTSLPGDYGVGSIGAEAHAFVDWLASAGMQVHRPTLRCLSCCLELQQVMQAGSGLATESMVDALAQQYQPQIAGCGRATCRIEFWCGGGRTWMWRVSDDITYLTDICILQITS